MSVGEGAKRAEEKYKDRLSENLKGMRLRRNMTLERLAKKAGVATYTVVQAEQGRTKPHPGTIQKLATALDCEVEGLTGY